MYSRSLQAISYSMIPEVSGKGILAIFGEGELASGHGLKTTASAHRPRETTKQFYSKVAGANNTGSTPLKKGILKCCQLSFKIYTPR